MRDRAPIRTDALDAYLAGEGDAVRWFTVEESLERLREAFTPADAGLGDPTLSPAVTLALWRWARAAGSALGRVGEDETLEAALETAEPCPWTVALRPRPTPVQRALLRLDSTSVLYRCSSDAAGLPLLPPRERERARNWCEAFSQAATDLRMVHAPRGPDALRLLTDPAAAPRVEVNAEAVLALEELLVDEAQRVLVRHGERAVVDHMRERYGLTRREGLSLVRLARADALLYGRSSIEEDRAVMVALLKDYLDRSRDSMNQNDEIRALKELARVQGLTRSEPEDRGAEFLGIVRRVAGRQDALHVAPAAAEALGVDEDDIAEDLDGELPTDADWRPLPLPERAG